ncbi:Uncharacterised protein [uncultured archaeon]|nr:Uncharacterised protein [uncultured archaeon]
MGLSIFFIADRISSAAAGEPPGLFTLITIAFTPLSSEASFRLLVMSSDVAIPNPVGTLPVSISPCTYITSTRSAEMPKFPPPRIRNKLPPMSNSSMPITKKYIPRFLELAIIHSMQLLIFNYL